LVLLIKMLGSQDLKWSVGVGRVSVLSQPEHFAEFEADRGAILGNTGNTEINA